MEYLKIEIYLIILNIILPDVFDIKFEFFMYFN